MDTDRNTARLALATASAVVAADLAYVAFAAWGQPFGSLNDVLNAASAVLAGWLAWSLRGRAGRVAAALALVGAAVAVVGSALVLSGATGWFRAAFVSAVGLGLLGPAVVATSRSLGAAGAMSRRLTRIGVVAGLVMTMGLLAAVPAAIGFDDPATAPAWAWLPYAGWVGAFLLYPVWAAGLGIGRSRPAVSGSGTSTIG
ncbi:MAG: hypothetical protein ACOYXS_05810 [Chloroflexota bacterium]